jgi:hypothetical protein
MTEIPAFEHVLEPWIETYSGKYLHFLDPREEEIEIEDIAHSLSMECRFGGHTSRFYSVAEHSILVASLLPRDLQLAGLLHDASEAYLRDIASPIKQYIGNYKEIEHGLMTVIANKYGFNWPMAPEIKQADTVALKIEARNLLPSKGESWIHLYPTDYDVDIKPHCLAPDQAEAVFMAAFNDLYRGGLVLPTTKEPEIILAK